MKKAFEIIKPILVLLSLCLVLTFALAATYNVTKPIIAERNKELEKEKMQKVLPDSVEFEQLNINFEGGGGAYKETTGKGYVFMILSNGYNGEISFMISISGDKQVKGIEILKINETPGLGTKIKDVSYLEKFKDKSSDNYTQVDGISGATISSKALKAAVSNAFECFDRVKEENL